MKSPFIDLDEEKFKDAMTRGNPILSPKDKKKLRRKFMLAVDVILLSNTAPVLEGFCVKIFFQDNSGQDHLNRWVRYLTETRKVQALIIGFPYFGQLSPVVLTLHLCSPESITLLELTGCILKSCNCCGSFTSIETLVLKGCLIFDYYVNKFFMGCPSLRSCLIEDFHPDGDLRFCAPWLKALTITGSWKTIESLETNAPSLEYLSIYSCEEVGVYLDDMQSLTTLELFYYDNEIPFQDTNIAELRRVKKLKIHADHLNIGYQWAIRENGVIVGQLDSLEHLSVHYFKYFDIWALLSMIHNAPKLQKLTLDEFVMDDPDFPPEDVDWSRYNQMALHSEVLKSLKQIQVIGIDCESIHLELFEFLLKHSSALESLEIKFLENADASCRVAFGTKLLALPRGGTSKIHLS